MDLLSIMSICENSRCVRKLEGIKGFNGFEPRDVCVWVNNDDLNVVVNDLVFNGFWKCFLIDDFEGVWFFVVMYRVGSVFGYRLFPVLEIEALRFI